MAADLSKIVEDLSALTVLEAAELSKMLEEKWGVSAAAPVAMMAAPAGGAAAPAEAAEEQTEFTVVLVSGGDKKINVIKEVRHHRSRPQGSQRPRRRRAAERRRERVQADRRRRQEEAGRRRRQGRNQVVSTASQLTLRAGPETLSGPVLRRDFDGRGAGGRDSAHSPFPSGNKSPIWLLSRKSRISAPG